MERLNRQTVPEVRSYPERILQFGEGNFLRAFVDWILYRMNRETDFNSGVVVVQPLPHGMVDVLNEQEGLYHVNLQGVDKGRVVDSIELVDVVSRGVNPYMQFEAYLLLAENPNLRFVISNTTEAGIAFDPVCRLEDKPPASFPGKLTQLLYHRYRFFEGAPDKGWIIFPCELIFDNGKELKKYIDLYIDLWGLGEEFREWVDTACGIYCTLVDRIVPGYPEDTMPAIRERTGVEDRMVVKAEVFHLWVIEAPEKIEKEFPASKAGLNVFFVPDEKPYHDRKVTLLNGPHTVLSPVGYLSGLRTVSECVNDPLISRYIHQVMYKELLPALNLPVPDLIPFAEDVLERFHNPFIRHFLTSIMLNFFSKFRTRDLPGLKVYREQKGVLPSGLVLGLAGMITYYKGGKQGEEEIIPADDPAILHLLQKLWMSEDLHVVSEGVLGAEWIWGEDLNRIPGLTTKLADYLRQIREEGMSETVRSIL